MGTPWGPGHRQWFPQVSDDEYTKLLSEGIQPVSTIDPNFASFTYTPRSLPEDDTSMVRAGMVPDCHRPLGQVTYPNPGGLGWGDAAASPSISLPARQGWHGEGGPCRPLSPPATHRVPSTGHPEHAAGHELHQQLQDGSPDPHQVGPHPCPCPHAHLWDLWASGGSLGRDNKDPLSSQPRLPLPGSA